MLRIECRIASRLASVPAATVWTWGPPEQTTVKLGKAAVLKVARKEERGVVFVSFESEWEKLLALGPRRLGEFSRHYRLVVAPTWSPPHSATNLVFPRLYGSPVVTTISHLDDLEIFPRLSENYRPVKLFASSWVNPNLYSPRKKEARDVDVVMVANFGRYKRHHALLGALASLPKGQRPGVVLVGQPQGKRDASTLQREIESYGVGGSVSIRSRISDEEVVAILCRSKVALVTSLREGSCVAVVEAMMADTPVGLLSGARIGSSCFLNERTGRWLDPNRLGEDLLEFVAKHRDYSPRAWLLENGVEHQASTRTLETELARLAMETGEKWTQGLFPHHWRPDPVLEREADRRIAKVECERIASRFGIQFQHKLEGEEHS